MSLEEVRAAWDASVNSDPLAYRPSLMHRWRRLAKISKTDTLLSTDLNFYGHLVSASWHSGDPEFVLGAMLPDFAAMAGARLPEVTRGALAQGVDFHHRCDRVFHGLRGFREQESWALQHLLGHGLRRGPARGIAHVGVELSLDGALVASSEGHDLYRSALEVSRTLALEWANQESAARFVGLMNRLSAMGVPDGYRNPRVVAERLVRIMKPRPLLRLTETEAPILRTAILEVHRRVDDESSEIMGELRESL